MTKAYPHLSLYCEQTILTRGQVSFCCSRIALVGCGTEEGDKVIYFTIILLLLRIIYTSSTDEEAMGMTFMV